MGMNSKSISEKKMLAQPKPKKIFVFSLLRGSQVAIIEMPKPNIAPPNSPPAT